MKIYKNFLFIALFFCSTLGSAQNVFWVINPNDWGPGSLRQAIADANASVSTIADTIKFNIPGSGVHTISPSYNLPLVTDPLFIDGLSQPGTSVNSWPVQLKIELEGSLIGSAGEGLIVSAGRSTIRGLIINRFGNNGLRLITGISNKVETCYIGTDSTGTVDLGNGRNGIFIGAHSSHNKIGGNNYQLRNLIAGNDLSGITIDGTDARYNTVAGNYIGTDASGLLPLGNGGKVGVWEDLYRAVYLNNSASYNTIGGSSPDDRNIISGNLGHGIYINSGTFNTIQNNYIGVDATGGNPMGNEFSGITLYAAFYNTIGGLPVHNVGNVIADNEVGITLTSYSTPAKSNLIFSNTIGLSAGGTPMGNGTGMLFSMNATRNEVHWNTISGNLGNGVTMTGNGVYENWLVYNEIYQNNGLCIDLNNDGPSANDVGDGDGGSNRTLNFPEQDKAFLNNNGEVQVDGTFISVPNKDYDLHFFASRTCNSTMPGQSLGEGEVSLGKIDVTTDANGEVDFTAELLGVKAAGRHISAIAVDEDRNTSEFSACISIPNWPSLGFGLNGEVNAAVLDTNGVLYVGGGFTAAGNVAVNYLAKWDGVSWSAVGGGVDAPVHALHFDVNGDLLVGGDFTTVGGSLSANRIARWDGQNWSAFGLGMNDRVQVIATSAGGTIYAGGVFTSADGNTQIKGIARWNATQWVGLGSVPQNVRSIVVLPSTEVVAGGLFLAPGPPYSYQIAKWNGANWTGLYNSSAAGVNDLVRKSNGNIFAADGHKLMEYDGNSWTTVKYTNGVIKDLALDANDKLFMGGIFNFSDNEGQSAKNLALWDGQDFYRVGGGVLHQSANTIVVDGDELYVGGDFSLANGVPAENIARFWRYYMPASSRAQSLEESPVAAFPADQHIFPNPFSAEVSIAYEVHQPAEVSVQIFNANGQLVKVLFEGAANEGPHTLSWNGQSDLGATLPNGLYICSIKIGTDINHHKLMLMK